MTKEKRSSLMSKIKSKWTQPEKKIHAFLKGQKIKHRMHPKLFGNPDVLLLDSNMVIFIDGCFWHKCPIHFVQPKTRIEFWKTKIDNNVKRDSIVDEHLKKKGYKIARIWEHEFEEQNYKFLINQLTLPSKDKV